MQKLRIIKIILEAELFSLDGSQRFYEKNQEQFKILKELGAEIGKSLKINQITIKNKMHILLTRQLRRLFKFDN